MLFYFLPRLFLLPICSVIVGERKILVASSMIDRTCLVHYRPRKRTIDCRTKEKKGDNTNKAPSKRLVLPRYHYRRICYRQSQRTSAGKHVSISRLTPSTPPSSCACCTSPLLLRPRCLGARTSRRRRSSLRFLIDLAIILRSVRTIFIAIFIRACLLARIPFFLRSSGTLRRRFNFDLKTRRTRASSRGTPATA